MYSGLWIFATLPVTTCPVAIAYYGVFGHKIHHFAHKLNLVFTIVFFLFFCLFITSGVPMFMFSCLILYPCSCSFFSVHLCVQFWVLLCFFLISNSLLNK